MTIARPRRCWRREFAIGLFVLLFVCLARSPVVAQAFGAEVVVTDEAGEAVSGAKLILQSAQGTMLRESVAAADGVFVLQGLPQGSYLLIIAAAGFDAHRSSLAITSGDRKAFRIKLSPAAVRGEISVTAQRGAVEDAAASASIVTVRDEEALRNRPLATLGNALEHAPGVLAQQSTHGQVSPFLRGLTGYQVLNLIDGVRFNNSTFRSGPNQYLAFIEPSQARRVEALLGPAGAQYGSDALGGTIQVLSNSPGFSGDKPFDVSGEWQAFAASADASGGGNLKVTLGAPRIALMAGGSWRRHNDLRAGGGEDSHHVFRRFLGLSSGLAGDRQQDTGFTQYGWQTKLAARWSDEQNLSLWHQRGVMEGVRGYKDLWGGLGRLRSDFEPQELNFFYARYEKLRLGFLDSLTGTFSINSQRDGTIRQNLRATDRITIDDNVVNAFGYAAQATTHFGDRQAMVFGAELYREGIRASRVETDPVANTVAQKRALFPNGSRYATLGLFARHNAEWFRGRLRSNLGGRFTRVSFRTFAERNRGSAGENLGVTDAAESFEDATFHAGVTWRVTERLNLHALAGRGFRAPNLNDLGALGLNDLGYELPASEVVAAGASIGASDGENALATGRKVGGLSAESLFNYELGVSWQSRRLYARAQVFDAELKRPIVRRTLLFDAATAPRMLAGIAVQPIAPTPEQRAQGVVTVATAFDPRAVKAFVNDGASKYYGLETLFRYSIAARWAAEGQYSFLAGRELNPNRFIRRLPPQQASLALRHHPSWFGNRISMIELSGEFAGAQERFSGGDLTDERIGAGRRRRDITDFFLGSLVRPFLDAGADRAFGSGDDLFKPTGETLAQIRDRVLPIGATVNGVRIVDDNSRAPLFTRTPGYAAMHLRAGWRLSERIALDFAAMNLLDKNYRVHGSGVDAPGRSFFLRLRYSF
jgi:outer membrane receptor protein involved in Fe transport